MKRILTIQDISCLGKCSLTVALPLISAMGVEAVILPTAMLSTHTMFKGFTVKDLSDQIRPIAEHWKKEGVKFDAIYTGYLGTQEEIGMIRELIRDFRGENTLIFVDPAMGDNGKLYPAFDEAYAKANAGLCSDADVIVPNITEGAFMTDMPYLDSYGEDYVREMLGRLCGLGAKTSVLTGVSLSEGMTGVMGYDTEKGEYFSYQHKRIPKSYHGTGDIFSSVALGGVVRGLGWWEAFRIAADYTADTIAVTMKNEDNPWYGVDFETTIPRLTQELSKALG